MPLTKIEKINANSFWCLWEITESIEQLKQRVVLSKNGVKELESISHEKKIKERLASRCCIQELVQKIGKNYKGIEKDIHDKPHLIGIRQHISISHCFPFAVAIIHKMLPVGIDIEKPVEKIGRIAHRFLNDDEFSDCNGEIKKLCIYWSGKEAIYKLNGKIGLNFKSDISISPFRLHKRDVIKSEFLIDEHIVRIALNYREINEHIVCYGF